MLIVVTIETWKAITIRKSFAALFGISVPNTLRFLHKKDLRKIGKKFKKEPEKNAMNLQRMI